eukprot:scaffold24764_cov60-Phaeocystis_antarctica.AAC.10
MFRTLDVSKLSGWLNFFASWGSKGRHTMWGEVRVGKQGGCSVGRRLHMQRVQGKARLESGRRVREECTLNISPMPVTQSKRGAYDVGRAACREAETVDYRWGAAAAHAACKGRLDWSLWAQGTGEVHPEHVVHDRDAGRVEAQRLVERLCCLPSRKEGIRCGAWSGQGGGEVVGGAGWPRMQRAREGSTGVWAQGAGGAHVEHGVHGRDARRVEAQRLVERLRFLPSKGGTRAVRNGVRTGSRGDRSGLRPRMQRAREGSTIESERRIRGECTLNISSIVETKDVSKLSGLLNALAFCRVERGEHTVRNGVRARSQGCRGGLRLRMQRAREKARLECERRTSVERT